MIIPPPTTHTLGLVAIMFSSLRANRLRCALCFCFGLPRRVEMSLDRLNRRLRVASTQGVKDSAMVLDRRRFVASPATGKDLEISVIFANGFEGSDQWAIAARPNKGLVKFHVVLEEQRKIFRTRFHTGDQFPKFFELRGRYSLASQRCRRCLDGPPGAKDVFQVDLGNPPREVIRGDVGLGKALNIAPLPRQIAITPNAARMPNAWRTVPRLMPNSSLRRVPAAAASRLRTRRRKSSRGFHEPVCWPKSPCSRSLHPKVVQ